MKLPDYVQYCLDALENAGFAAYCVGGCVRDSLLGLTPHDYDICTAALPEQTEAVFAGKSLVLAGKKHGTVGVIFGKDVVEITTFRTEGQYLDNRHPEWVEFVPNVEADLARRDFTVNAMAWSPKRGLSDPFAARRSNQSILKEIHPEHSLEGLMLKLKLQYLGHLMQRVDSLEKTLMLGKIEGRRRRE